MADRDLQEDVQVDRFALDEELEKVAETYRYWAEQSADARADADRSKDRLELVMAEVALEIRNGSEKKPTESTIEAMMLQHPKVQKAKADFISAKHSQAILEGAVRALDHKRSQLDNLTRLWIAGYYADPKRTSRTDDLADAGAKGLNRHRRTNQEE